MKLAKKFIFSLIYQTNFGKGNCILDVTDVIVTAHAIIKRAYFPFFTRAEQTTTARAHEQSMLRDNRPVEQQLRKRSASPYFTIYHTFAFFEFLDN